MDSLLNKRNELDVLITKHKPTIIALTEIMPKNCKNVIPSEFDLYNYDKFVNDIKQRGVILYVHKEIKATEVTVDENGDFDEYIMCEVKTNTPGVTLLLTCIYRSPNSSEDNNAKLIKGGGWSRKGLNFEWPYFCQYLSELYQIFSSCVLCGYIIN